MPSRNHKHRDHIALAPDQVAVALSKDPTPGLEVAETYGVGVEVQTFSEPAVLNHDFSDLLGHVEKACKSVSGPVGCHGPFIDTAHYSLDVEIMQVSRMRYLQAFEIAKRLKAKYVLFHSQYNPIIKIVPYPEIYHGQSMKFWPELVEQAERLKLPIYLENMFEDSPTPLIRICNEIRSPYLRLCLDIAHAVVFSKIDMAEWIESFSPYLSLVHLSDCDGEYDDHFGLGEGSIDFGRFFTLMESVPQPITYALETHNAMASSVEFLGVKPRKAAGKSKPSRAK